MNSHRVQMIRDGFQRRAEAINDLNFTYDRLRRLLPALFRRAPEARLAEVLKEQHEMDIDSQTRLRKVAMDMGQPPGPCVCEEADRLVDNVYHADRTGSDPKARTWGIVNALKFVRVHLIRTWSRLIGELQFDEQASFREQAIAVQERDASSHRQLTELTNQLEEQGRDGSRDGGKRRSA